MWLSNTRIDIQLLLLTIVLFSGEGQTIQQMNDSPDRPTREPKDNEPTNCGPNNESTCVKFYQCSNEKTAAPELFDFRIHSLNECAVGEVCCPNEQIAGLKKEEKFRKCGKRNMNGTHSAQTNFADHQSQIGEFPWAIAILQRNNTIKVYCSGSLIHPRVVLTAARYFVEKEKSAFILRAGAHDLSRVDESFHQDRNIDRMVLHDFAILSAPTNNIALLFAESPFILTPNVGTVCLPDKYDPLDFEGAQCLAAGWGADSWDGNYRTVQKKVELYVRKHSACQRALRGTRLGNFFNLPEISICASPASRIDTCNGDIGAAMVCPKILTDDIIPDTTSTGDDGEIYVQIGIVSWGIQCNNHIPRVYTNVAHYKDWIDGHMVDLGTDYYTK